jgi:hypothetical protein
LNSFRSRTTVNPILNSESVEPAGALSTSRLSHFLKKADDGSAEQTELQILLRPDAKIVVK